MAKAMKAALNTTEEEFYKGFAKEMKRRYWPEIARRKEPDDIATQLTHAQKDGSYFNEKPVYSPEGDKLAIFTDKRDYTEIVLISALDGHELVRLVKGSAAVIWNRCIPMSPVCRSPRMAVVSYLWRSQKAGTPCSCTMYSTRRFMSASDLTIGVLYLRPGLRTARRWRFRLSMALTGICLCGISSLTR